MTLAGLRPGEKLFEEKLMAEESVIELLNRYYTENKEEIHACGYFFINKRKSRFTEQSIKKEWI